MAHRPSYHQQNSGGGGSSAGRRHEQDVPHDLDVHTVVDCNTWPVASASVADEHHQRSHHPQHHYLHVPLSADTPMQGVHPVIPWSHLSVPVGRWSDDDGTNRVTGTYNGIGISEHQQEDYYDDDYRWGRGHHHHHQHVGGGNGVFDQGLHDVEFELRHQVAAADNHRTTEENPSFSPSLGPGAVGGGCGSGAAEIGASNAYLPWLSSAEFEHLGRRRTSVNPSKPVLPPISVKDTMSWPKARYTSWPLPPIAPSPHFSHAPHQPQVGADENNTEILFTPEYDKALSDNIGAASRAPGSHKPMDVRPRMKRKCEHLNCQRGTSFGKAGQKAVRCAKHKLDGMINVVSRKCAKLGCDKGPSYGEPGERKPVFCSGHRLPGQINVISPRCLHEGCRKGPSFGWSGTGNRATRCATHKLAGMVNVISRSCKEEGCKTAPSFGFEGERATFCGKHKRDGHRNVISRRCDGPGCTKVPSYGKPEDPRPTFCAHHKPPGAINLLTHRCPAPGCMKGPVGGKPGFCRVHSA